METENSKKSVEKLIAFFKTLKQKIPRPDPADYSFWDQTEEEYQKQQAEWLNQVKQKKQKKQNDKNG